MGQRAETTSEDIDGLRLFWQILRTCVKRWARRLHCQAVMPVRRLPEERRRALRDLHWRTVDAAKAAHASEATLLDCLREMDEIRGFVWVGYNSLSGYCRGVLKITRTQTQRLVTLVRRPCFGQELDVGTSHHNSALD